MAAYAALVSLLNTVDHIQSQPHLSNCFVQNQIESLTKTVHSLLDFLEHYTSHGDLESQITSAADAAEDVIESHIVDQILARSTENRSLSLLDLQKIIEEMNSVEEKAMKVKQERGFKDLQRTYSTPAPSISLAGKTTMVGFEDYVERVMYLLTNDERKRQIIPITGMGGIGKTTLARNIYEKLNIGPHFDLYAWVTVSQEYSVRKILFEILSCLGESTREMIEKTEVELSVKLHKTLTNSRYLVIVDDIWSIDAWDAIKFYLPDNFNKSRMIVTTRQLDVANYFSSSALALNFLDYGKSWKLFCHNAFGQLGCPFDELVTIGNEIVRKCMGLPLSLAVIGGLLGKSSKTPEDWEIVANDISSALESAGDSQYQNLFSVSYNYLPACLKPCFLYLGIFQEDHEIRVSRLIKLWIAEGLLKPDKEQNLEDVAKGFVQDLIDRNLILAGSFGSNGKLKTCKVHDLLREICIRVVEKEKFLCITRVLDTPRDLNMERRIINLGTTGVNNYSRGVFDTFESTSLARSLICESPALLPFKSRLLRVLVEAYSDSLADTFKQVNLRFLAYESVRAPIGWVSTYELPSSISLLWNVQTIIIDRSVEKVVAPSEIWEMRQLRHLEFYRVWLPDPPPRDEEDGFVLQNLQTVKTVLDFKCSEEVCKRMHNIRKLQISYDDFSKEGQESSRYCLYNVFHFGKLESLSCCFNIVPNRDDLLQNLKFPRSLKKLVLQYCELQWEDLTVIGSLPHLEVLKLKHEAVRGHNWDVEGEFIRLKFLEIDSIYLIYWVAEDSHFPVLEKLVLGGLYKLDEIPSGMAEIPTLQSISVVECSVSAAISAISILDEKVKNGDEGLQVRIGFREKQESEEFKEKVDLCGFTRRKFQVDLV